MNETNTKLTEFADLQPGWYYGRGQAMIPEALNWAKDMALFFPSIGIDQTDAFPDPEGGVRVCGYYKHYYFEITYELNGTISCGIGEYGIGIDVELEYCDNLTPDEAKDLIQIKYEEYCES